MLSSLQSRHERFVESMRNAGAKRPDGSRARALRRGRAGGAGGNPGEEGYDWDSMAEIDRRFKALFDGFGGESSDPPCG